MSYPRIPPEDLPCIPSTSDRHHLDHPTRRRATSCPMVDSGVGVTLYGHIPSSTVHVPTSPYPLSYVLAPSSSSSPSNFGAIEQPGFSDHRINAECLSIGGRGITQHHTPDLTSPVSLNTGGSSVLGFEPGPAVVYLPSEIYREHQHRQDPPAIPMSPDYSSSPFTLDHPLVGPRFTVTEAPLEGLSPPGQSFSSGYEPYSARSCSFSSPPLCTAPSPSSPHRPREQNLNFLCAPLRYGLGTPTSHSSLSSPSASLSELTIGTPRSSVGEMDDDGSYRTFLQHDFQVQGDPQWGANSNHWSSDQDPLSPGSPPWSGYGTELHCNGTLPTVLPKAPPATITTDMSSPTLEASFNVAASSPSQLPQSFPGGNPHPLSEGGRVEAFPTNSQPNPLPPSFPSIPHPTHEHQRNGLSEFGRFSHLDSVWSGTSELADHTFSRHVDESYKGTAFDYCIPTSQDVGPSGSHSTARSAPVHRTHSLNRRSGLNAASMRRRCSQASQEKNRLLHISISVLEQRRLIPQASSLRDTVRFIINTFESNPTRQEIVDRLFEALPEHIRDRVGHILSAAANKDMFANNDGRWSLK
ncbi:hypothetical protein M407DRAFT_26949 [Tulasnella calospora MUT 4182]|uniref:Uncharacterized protein n=1 Tax=Tulasnella calospora MUT 4182 TaxID=1051891 RepID=A0A0C3QDB5_9AGAM|nr:hypothetical protein M407DRAFT_26949 [Tulasnella calospora MUT 4182]